MNCLSSKKVVTRSIVKGGPGDEAKVHVRVSLCIAYIVFHRLYGCDRPL